MANPTWFDVDTYMANKLAQIQAIEPKGAWTEEKLKKAFEDNGYKGDEGVFQHFIDFGMDENVSPNAQFDAVFYLRAKADQLNTIMQDGKSDWSVVNVLDAINAAGNITSTSALRKALLLPPASTARSTLSRKPN